MSNSPTGSSSRIGDLAARVAGRRTKWFIIALWLIAAIATAPLQGLLEERSTNSSTSFLPAAADSTKVADLLTDGKTFPDDRTVPAIVVFQAENGDRAISTQEQAELTKWLAEIQADAADFPTLSRVQDPWQAGGPAAANLVSEDGSTALAFIALEDPDSEQIIEVVEELRDRANEIDLDGVNVYVSGPAGLAADAAGAFAGIDGKLLIGTSILVLVLLLLIYRSPLIALVPLIAVSIAAMLSRAVLGLSIEPFDLTVSGQTSGIMLILIFGAGTDYCLLIVARFREELLRFRDPHDAMREAVRHTTPAILSSAGTVIATMFVLLLADLRSTSSLGPALIIGVTIAMLAGLTLLPAMLLALGRRSFWPFVPKYGDTVRQRFDVWGRLASAIKLRPTRWLVSTTVVLLVAASGILLFTNQPVSDVDIFLNEPESTQGLDAIAKTLPAGELAQGTILVGATDPGTLEQATGTTLAQLEQQEDIGDAFPTTRGSSGDIEWQQITFAFEGNPYSEESVDSVTALRADLKDAVADIDGARVLVGGPTAETADTQSTNRRDLTLIVPAVLGAIFLILVLLLRAVVAPLHLIGTVILSFVSTLGICYMLFFGLLDQPGIDAGTITFIFLFTAALGIDYNIFLVARIREEAARRGTVEGTAEALRVTGGVITSAGVILAGTFLILAALPLLPLRQLGIAVAIGVLLDTILVRAMLVPAIMVKLGDRNWWPAAPPSAAIGSAQHDAIQHSASDDSDVGERP